jgi:hypothetical protein
MAHLSTSTLIAAALWASGATALSAQVGHDPDHSPYRDLKYSQFLTVTAGYFRGDGGDLGLGPHNGSTIMLRHDFMASGAVTLGLAGGFGKLERFVADTAVSATKRLLGPVDQRVWFAEGVVQFNVVGGKTWHNISPFISGALGLAFNSTVPSDSSGFKLGTRFYFAPAIGARVFVTRRLYLKLEARSIFWSLSYPTPFSQDPDGEGPKGPLLGGGSLKEWSPSGWYQIGLGYAFHRPF